VFLVSDRAGAPDLAVARRLRGPPPDLRDLVGLSRQGTIGAPLGELSNLLRNILRPRAPSRSPAPSPSEDLA